MTIFLARKARRYSIEEALDNFLYGYSDEEYASHVIMGTGRWTIADR